MLKRKQSGATLQRTLQMSLWGDAFQDSHQLCVHDCSQKAAPWDFQSNHFTFIWFFVELLDSSAVAIPAACCLFLSPLNPSVFHAEPPRPPPFHSLHPHADFCHRPDSSVPHWLRKLGNDFSSTPAQPRGRFCRWTGEAA